MQTIWFPTPVVVLFRRLVNVVGTLSISHQYFLQPPANRDKKSEVENHNCSWKVLKSLGWLSWASRELAGTRFSLAVESDASAPPPFEPSPPRRPHIRPPPQRPRQDLPMDTIHRLMHSPTLYDPVRVPRHPIVLCHGLYGFDVRGPAAFPILQKQYWSNVLSIVREKLGAEVIVTSVPSTGSITSRAQSLHEILTKQTPGRSVNFLAHSMGGLDCRYLISHIKPTAYTPVSLTTIATPHRGSPFMDWCSENLGLGKIEQNAHKLANAFAGNGDRPPEAKEDSPKPSTSLSLTSLPSSFTTLLLSLLDSPAYANLSTSYLTNVFNPNTPDDPRVRYFSVAGRLSSMNIWHPLWLPKMVLDGYEQRQMEQKQEKWRYEHGGHRWGNDGLVTVQSAKWGEFLGVLEECDHWELRGARGIELDLWNTSSSSGNGSDGWSLGDWGRFVGAWKKEEKRARDVGAILSEREEKHSEYDAAKARVLDEKVKAKDHGVTDDVVTASTEKLSAVFDWIVDQVPVRSSSGSDPDGTAQATVSRVKEHNEEEGVKKTQLKSELATKAELEQFYVALCRKLYDEGF
ncbi:Alpha/Beta hydrolase protein [Irpex rosettiformis]|uniref:Alpha/Beta hydrolase protein n=1 Tax=Irpex rosettiformis TaxID=378272 RepID=A0ACB8U2N9_9APHY|nr:Alpha/Beta hydrolase protein [Irpex rosettiformis]